MKQIAGLSPVLFHRTNTRAAANILKMDRFELKPSEGTEMEQQFGNAYYLSTARSPNSAYIKSGVSSQSVVFELDGVKLSQRFKGKAVDYWGPSFYKYTETDGTTDQRAVKFEAEDRVLSKDKFLPASKYIRAVYVMAPKAGESNVNVLGYVYNLKRYCLLRKIPIHFFTDFTSLLHRDLRKAVPYKPVKPGVDKDAYVYPREYLETKALNPRRKTDSLAMWYALYKIPKKPDVGSYTQIQALGNKKLSDIYNRLRYSDALQGLNADMHNAKSTSYGDDSKEREHLDKLVDAMRRSKQTPVEWLNALRLKWYPPEKPRPEPKLLSRDDFPDVDFDAVQQSSLLPTDGVYVSATPTEASVSDLKAWLTTHVLSDWEFTNEDDLHCTIMYSFVPARNWVQSTRVTRGRVLLFDLFGPDNNTLVVRLFAPELQERHDAWLGYGCKPTYPDYKPHITVSFKTQLPDNSAKLIAQYNQLLKEKPLYMEFNPEVVEPLKD